MIGYRLTRKELEALIEAEVPGWLARARARTKGFVELGRYEEKSSIWSEIKAVYMRLQGGSKCAFCERKLESEGDGLIEQDVEHFRPKKRVLAWKPSAGLSAEGVQVGAPPAGGYYRLAYDPFNYTAACKPCNSSRKRDCFPVAGVHRIDGETPEALAAELPLLIYPLGDFDTDPEQLIRFQGISPQPVAAAGHDRHRALATIEFFGLDAFDRRKNLIRERATVIVTLHPQLKDRDAGGAQASVARKIIDAYTASSAPHANCSRSFVALYERDPAEAGGLFEAASSLLASQS